MSTYTYETLSPEAFQQFCQALLIAAFPNTQCLPVGQPDGGRDAFMWRWEVPGGGKDLIAFQVKFSRSPGDEDERDFIENVVRSEGPKVERLKKRGMRAYYLITNVRGTAHLDTGSVDRVNEALSEAFGIPSYCWWRDDIDRRVDGHSDIKWSYPDIIRGSDLLQALYEGLLGEDSRRREDAIRAYVASQYRDDATLKFKQVELQNNLLDLFVDTPVRFLPRPPRNPHAQLDDAIERFVGIEGDELGIVEYYHDRAHQAIGAGIRSREEAGAVGQNIFDPSASLLSRARFARLRSGASEWWSRQFEGIGSERDRCFALLVFFTWATPKTLARLALTVSAVLDEMSKENWTALARSVTRVAGVRSKREDAEFDEEGWASLAQASSRFQLLTGVRSGRDISDAVFLRLLKGYDGVDLTVLRFCADTALSLAFRQPGEWESVLPIIRRSYALGVASDLSPAILGREDKIEVPEDVAKRICVDPSQYPLFVVSAAEASLARMVGARMEPVAKIAREGWVRQFQEA